MTVSQRQPPSPRNRTLGLIKKAGKPRRLGGPWTRKIDEVENWEGKPYLLSEGHRRRLSDTSTRRNASYGPNLSQSCQLIPPSTMYGIEWGKYLTKIPDRYCWRTCCSIHRQKSTTTNPSDWDISGDQSWRPNPVHLDLVGSIWICWNISLRTH